MRGQLRLAHALHVDDGNVRYVEVEHAGCAVRTAHADPVDRRACEVGGGLPLVLVLEAELQAHRQPGDAQARGRERGADRSRVQHEVAGVLARVDARRDEIGRLAERAETRGEHRGRGWRVERVDRNAGKFRPVRAHDERGSLTVQLADAGARATPVRRGREHRHVVPVVVQREREDVDAG